MFEGSHVVIFYVAMATVENYYLFFSRSVKTVWTVKHLSDVTRKIKKTEQYAGKI